MAVPTISSLSPTTGMTGGRYVIAVVGTGFQLPGALPSEGPVPRGAPTVRAWFVDSDGALVEAERVDVASATKLFVIAPSHDLGLCSLRVDNVDSSGVTITGETVTRAASFEFKRPMLSGEPRTAERILARVVRSLRRLFVREVLEEVSITVHTDFDADPDDGTNTIEVAKLPSLVLVGPTLRTNRFYSSNVKRSVDLQDGGWSELRPSRTVDVSFGFIGLSEFTQELANFAQEVAAFFQRNPYLYVDRDPADPAQGRVRYELEMTDAPSSGSSPNDSNVRQFHGSCVIRGVDLDDAAMTSRMTRTVQEVVLNPGDAQTGTGAGGDVLVGDGTTDPLTGGPLAWPVYFNPAIYQLLVDQEE